jgi:processive 1,2-diacylglycerol beta-glucosyltransferase
MECITCNLPVIITGTLPGQEEGNVDYILGNGLGLLCNKEKDLLKVIDKMIRNDKQRLIEIKKNQLKARDLDAAAKIVDALMEI